MPNFEPIEGIPVERAASPGAFRDPNAATAINRGNQAIAAGLGDVGNVLGAYAAKAADAKNRATLVDADRAMAETWENFQSDLEKNPNQEEWSELWQERADELRGTIMEEGHRPDVRAALEQQLTHWSETNRVRVESQAADREIQVAKAKFVDNAQFYWERGDFESGAKAINAAMEAGVIWPEDGKAILDKARVTVDINNANQSITEDPRLALQALQDKTDTGRPRFYKNLDENTRLSLIREARVQVSQLRADTVRDFQGRINQHLMQRGKPIPLSELQTAVDEDLLTPQQMKWLNDQQTGEGSYSDALTRSLALKRRIVGLAEDDPNYTEKSNAIAVDMAGLPEDMQSRLETLLFRTERDGGGFKPAKEALAYQDTMLKSGAMGDVSTFDGQPLSPDQFRLAHQRDLALTAALQKAIQDNPKMTLPEQGEFIDRWIANLPEQHGAAAGSLPIFNFISGASAK